MILDFKPYVFNTNIACTVERYPHFIQLLVKYNLSIDIPFVSYLVGIHTHPHYGILMAPLYDHDRTELLGRGKKIGIPKPGRSTMQLSHSTVATIAWQFRSCRVVRYTTCCMVLVKHRAIDAQTLWGRLFIATRVWFDRSG